MYEIGTVVKSLRGRDAGKLLSVTGETSGYILVADGKERSVRRPKKKNPRHIAPVLDVPPLPPEALRGDRQLRRHLFYIKQGILPDERKLTDNAEVRHD
ncbi:MAG: KOW domain-containing RNA-binding protein [Oscillospiraceae bacterium]|jgi:hypothetical protein|nr:KOW domain-containing RNA-binding protein [Oscillospiraceae bacterium]